MAAAVKDRIQVAAHQGPPVLRLHVCEEADVGDAGIVYKDVCVAESLKSHIAESPGIFPGAHISGKCQTGRSVLTADAGGKRLKFLRPLPAAKSGLPACLGKVQGGCFPYASRGPCYDCCFIHHVFLHAPMDKKIFRSVLTIYHKRRVEAIVL